MPRELILHIGMSKTGSSSIQYLLDINRSALLAQGFSYPGKTAGNSHALLATAFTSFPVMLNDTEHKTWQGRAPEVAIGSYIAELEAEVAGLPHRVSRIILSAEQFGKYQRTQADIRRLRDFVVRLADRCIVVVYLRRQDEHFASLYSQFLRWGKIGEPDMQKLNPLHQDYDYADLLARWADVFGKQNVVPRLFERPAGKHFDVVADFAGLCGFDLAPLRLHTDVNRNQSMNLAGQEVLRRLGARLSRDTPGGAPAGTAWQRVTEAVSAASPGKGWLPTQAQARAFMDRYAASNEAVRAAYFPERTSLFQMKFDSLPEHEATLSADDVQTATIEALLVCLQQGMARELKLHLQRADMAKASGDLSLQRSALFQAVRLDGKHLGARLRLAKCFADQGDLESASQQFDAAAELSPDCPQVAAFRARIAKLKKKAHA